MNSMLTPHFRVGNVRYRTHKRVEMTAIILAGGKSSRMGFDKAFIKIRGIPIIKRQLKQLKQIFKKIIIVTNNPLNYKFKGARVIGDLITERGPLGGIYSGLKASFSDYNFVVACDMPFLNKALIRYMIKDRDNYDVVIAKIDGKFHPLFGLYSKNCIPAIEEMLKQNKLKVSSIFPKVKSHFILRREIRRFDRDLLSLLNINTEGDLAILKELGCHETRSSLKEGAFPPKADRCDALLKELKRS